MAVIVNKKMIGGWLGRREMVSGRENAGKKEDGVLGLARDVKRNEMNVPC